MSEFLKSVEKQPIQNENNDIFDLGKINEKYGKFNKDFDVFEGYLNTLENNSLKQQILQIFNSDNRRDYIKIKRYIKRNGFPNSRTIDDFKSSFLKKDIKNDIEVKREDIEVKREDIEVKREDIEVKRDILGEILSDIEPYNFYFDEKFITSLNDAVSNNNSNTLDEYLVGENLDKVLKTLKKIDLEKGLNGDNSIYQKVTDKLISLDPSFEAKINTFENQLNLSSSESVFDLPGARMKAINDSSLLGENLYKGGVDASLDLTKRPPERFLSSGSGYKLETPLGVRDFYQATVDYEKGKQILDKDRLEIMKSGKAAHKEKNNKTRRIEELNDKGFNFISNEENIELVQLKKKIIELDAKIKVLIDQYYTFDKKYIDLEKKYKIDLSRQVENYRKTIKEQDENSLETLNFIHSIGFDMIPQNITDTVISQLNSNTGLRNSLGFQNDINLKEGNLGTNKDQNLLEMNTAEKVVFAEFVNVMISGDKTGPIYIDAISGGTGSPIKDRYKFKDKLIGFQDFAGVRFAMDNIESSFKQENNNN